MQKNKDRLLTRWSFNLIISLLFSFLISPAIAQIEQTEYIEKTGTKSTKITRGLDKSAGANVFTYKDSSGKTSLYKTDSSGSTLQWQLNDAAGPTNLVAKRDGKAILVSGTFKGETIKKKVAIDHAPWYQSIALSLAWFVKSDKPSIVFWSLRPDKLLPFKLKAKKVKTEFINLNGKRVEAERVKITLTGLKSMFWQSNYWFRKSDNLFIRYEGVDGPPGTPETVTTLSKEVLRKGE